MVLRKLKHCLTPYKNGTSRLLEDKNIAFQWIYKEAEAQSCFLVANHQYKCEKVQKSSEEI